MHGNCFRSERLNYFECYSGANLVIGESRGRDVEHAYVAYDGGNTAEHRQQWPVIFDISPPFVPVPAHVACGVE